jgi:endonuclease/exonuclease/phosphatase family metal-dependent hydrolase
MPPGARDLTVFDQNLYVGSEFTPLLTLDPTDPDYFRNLLMGVAQVYQTILASDFPSRAQVIAGEIAATRPDLVALQEVSLIRTQVPGDLLVGGTTPATDVQLDYLAILLANLNQHGVHYQAVAIVTNLDMELPMPTTDPTVFADVRLTDHDVILARADLPPGQLRVRNAQAGNFQTALPLPNLGTSIARGWCAVDVTTRGRTLRFINAHLEENVAAPIQAAQARELLAGPANTPLPAILVGDFNSDAYGNDGTTTYAMLTQNFTDVWSAVHPRNPGLTWGHDPLLADPSVAFVWRLDLVLVRGSGCQALDMWRMSPQFQATPPLWPSDHAGVVARFRIK